MRDLKKPFRFHIDALTFFVCFPLATISADGCTNVAIARRDQLLAAVIQRITSLERLWIGDALKDNGAASG